MAVKFLSRPEAKQRIFRIDLGHTGAPEGKEGSERAIVVTAEAEQLSYFWSDGAGEWHFHTRAHAPLRPLAIAPDQTLEFPWSRRNGVAVEGDLAVIAFKREFEDERHVGLFVDILAWSESDAAWLLSTAQPIPVPIHALCRGIGLDVWAWLAGRELSVIAQAWMGRDTIRGQPLLGPAEPRLILAQATVDLGNLAALQGTDAWRTTVLDDGGFDLDARFHNGRFWAVHRRTAASMSVQFNPSTDSATIWMLDALGTLNLDGSLVVAEMPATVVVSYDPANASVKIEAEDLPSVEHPQLQRTDPLIVTGDRWRFAEVSTNRRDDQWTFSPRLRQADKVMIWRGRNIWRMEPVGPLDQGQWPLNLTFLASSHWMLAVRDGKIHLATMLSPKPTWLWQFDVTQKGVELTFGREDRRIGGIACDRFQFSPDLVDGSPDWIGMSVLDISHEQIALDFEGESGSPVENTQFEGAAQGATALPGGGGTVQFFFPTANTLGGLLAAHQDLGHALCAYVGMGDGGGRVILESKVDPLSPTTTERFKTLPPDVVTGPRGESTAWVTLGAADFTPGQLPGYSVPYGDFMRTMAPPDDPLAFAFVLSPLDALCSHLTPRSLAGGLQPLLDVMPLAGLLAAPSLDGLLGTAAPTVFELDRSGAIAIQNTLATFMAGTESEPVASDPAQPFAVQWTHLPGRVRAGSPVTLRARIPGAAVTTFSFRWTLRLPPVLTALNVLEFEGSEVTANVPLNGAWTVRLRVQAADGRTSEVNSVLVVEPSLWQLVWQPHREIGGDRLRLGSTTLELMRHRIAYRVADDGARESVRIEYLPETRSLLRFEDGVAAQQGRTTLRLPITVSSQQGSFTGLLGSVVALKRAEVRLNLERPFTLGVVTSDRRSFDVLQNEFYAEMDSTDDAPANADVADVETVRQRIASFEPGRAVEMLPNALSAKPVGDSTVRRPGDNDLQIEVVLTPLAWNVSYLVGFVIALNLVAFIMVPLLLMLMPFGLAIGSFAVVVGLAVSAGLGWLFVSLTQAAASALAHSQARDTLSSPEALATVADALEEAGVINYAGEGLAEAIAIQAIQKAREDGHAMDPPAHEQPSSDPTTPRPPSGRERFRSQLFETVVVGAGVCRVLMRVR